MAKNVSINSPSGEGGENPRKGGASSLRGRKFPLILLQAKAVSVGFSAQSWAEIPEVSINSPSGEGGESYLVYCGFLSSAIEKVSINSPSGEGGEFF